jgi:hypothetical protein
MPFRYRRSWSRRHPRLVFWGKVLVCTAAVVALMWWFGLDLSAATMTNVAIVAVIVVPAAALVVLVVLVVLHLTRSPP